MRVWVLGFNILWLSRVFGAGTSGDTWFGWISVSWVVRVEPKHVDCMVIPDGKDKSHSCGEGLGHLAHTSLSGEVVLVTEPSLDGGAEVVAESLVLFTSNSHRWGINDLSVLDIFSSNLNDFSAICSVVGEELSNNLEFLGGVNLELAAWSIESAFSMSEGGEIATIFVADARVSLILGVITAVGSFASLSIGSARMSSESLRDAVSFPDVELHAAGSVFTASCVGVRWAWVPPFGVSFTIDEFNVVWALGITISNTVVSTGLVIWICSFSTIGWHLSEIKSAIDTAWKV